MRHRRIAGGPASAELLSVEHVQVDVQPPTGSLGGNVGSRLRWYSFGIAAKLVRAVEKY